MRKSKLIYAFDADQEVSYAMKYLLEDPNTKKKGSATKGKVKKRLTRIGHK